MTSPLHAGHRAHAGPRRHPVARAPHAGRRREGAGRVAAHARAGHGAQARRRRRCWRCAPRWPPSIRTGRTTSARSGSRRSAARCAGTATIRRWPSSPSTCSSRRATPSRCTTTCCPALERLASRYRLDRGQQRQRRTASRRAGALLRGLGLGAPARRGQAATRRSSAPPARPPARRRTRCCTWATTSTPTSPARWPPACTPAGSAGRTARMRARMPRAGAHRFADLLEVAAALGV